MFGLQAGRLDKYRYGKVRAYDLPVICLDKRNKGDKYNGLLKAISFLDREHLF